MSKVYTGWFTWGDIVNNNIITIPGFSHIDAYEISLSAPVATPSENNIVHYSVAKTDGSHSYAHSNLFSTVTGASITRLSEVYAVQHYDIDPSTNLTRRVISGTHVAFATSGSNTTIEIDYDRATTDYKQYITVWGS